MRAKPFFQGGEILPLHDAFPSYQVNGRVLPTQPSVRTAPIGTGFFIAQGTSFVLGFADPDSATQAMLTSGVVTLAFSLSNGSQVSGLVQLQSSFFVSQNFLNVYCVLLEPIFLFGQSQSEATTTMPITITQIQILDANENPITSGNPLPISALALPLPTGAAQEGGNLAAVKADADALVASLGAPSDNVWSGTGSGTEIAILKKLIALIIAGLSVSGSVSVSNFPGNQTVSGSVSVSNFPGTQPVSATSLPLPTGAAKESGGNLDTIATNTVGLATASNQSTANTSLSGIKGDLDTLVGTVSGGKVLTTPPQSNVTADYDTSAGTQNLTMYGVALPGSGGAVAGGTPTNPLRTDPTGTTTQPVSGSVSVSNFPGTQPVSGTVTVNAGANLNTSLLALESGGNLAALASGVQSSKYQSAIASIATNLSQANQVPVSNAGQQGMLSVSGTLTANQDNALTFSGNSTVARRIRIQNESAGTIYWALDGAASAGSPSLPAPAANTVVVEWINMACTTLHIFIPSGGTTTLNGSGGVKVSAWA